MMCHTELTEIFKQSRDPEELKHYWIQWRDKSGKKMRTDFKNMMAIIDLAAKMNSKMHLKFESFKLTYFYSW